MPVMLGALLTNQLLVIALSDLLGSSYDPDGDTLGVGDLHASSGTLTANIDGSWNYVASSDDTSTVTFNYLVQRRPRRCRADRQARHQRADCYAHRRHLVGGASSSERRAMTRSWRWLAPTPFSRRPATITSSAGLEMIASKAVMVTT